VRKVRHDTADYAKRLLADVNAARDEMNARFAKAIAADENAGEAAERDRIRSAQADEAAHQPSLRSKRKASCPASGSSAVKLARPASLKR
jgi:hypothetical protein